MNFQIVIELGKLELNEDKHDAMELFSALLTEVLTDQRFRATVREMNMYADYKNVANYRLGYQYNEVMNPTPKAPTPVPTPDTSVPEVLEDLPEVIGDIPL